VAVTCQVSGLAALVAVATTAAATPAVRAAPIGSTAAAVGTTAIGATTTTLLWALAGPVPWLTTVEAVALAAASSTLHAATAFAVVSFRALSGKVTNAATAVADGPTTLATAHRASTLASTARGALAGEVAWLTALVANRHV